MGAPIHVRLKRELPPAAFSLKVYIVGVCGSTPRCCQSHFFAAIGQLEGPPEAIPGSCHGVV